MSNVISLLTRFQDTNFENESEVETAVNDLMCSLINDYVLNVNGNIYDFCEIELYYKSPNHNDCGVLNRDNKKAGDIFFHRYGMDICFNSNGTDEYGGILIRSLKQGNQYICGAWESSYKLLNSYHGKLCISIAKKEAKKTEEVCKTTRIKSLCKENKYNLALYRYVTKDACTDIQNNEKNKEYLKKIQEKICNGEKKENND